MKNSRLSYAVLIVMISTLLSRLIGFIREMLLPNMLSIGVETDAYNNAFVLPDLMYSLLLGGAVSAALIPVLSGYIDTNREKEGWRIVSNFINAVFMVMFILCILGMIFSKELMGLLISGDDKQRTRELAASTSRILFPSIAFLMLAGILNGILNSYKRFAAAALGPIIYNIGSALSIYFLSRYGVEKIAMGVLASAFIYFLTVLMFSLKNLKDYRPVFSILDRRDTGIFKLALPSFLSASVVQLNIMVSIKFVNFFEEGRVTAFRLADRTWQMPYGIIAVSMGIALLPTLSGVYANKDIDRFKELIIKSIKYILTLILPCCIAVVVLNERIVNTLFRFSGNLTIENIGVISTILLIFSVALITQSCVAIFNRAFYSMQNTSIPLFTGASTIALNILLSWLFYKTTDLDVYGIAFAYCISSLVNLVLLSVVLKTKVKEMPLGELLKYVLRIVPSLAILGAVIFVMDMLLPSGEEGVTFVSKISQIGALAFVAFTGAVTYFLMIIVTRVPEGIEIFKRICIKLKLKRLVNFVN